jgi:pimeloyl-ACP methyl ester carboxylesterase
MKLDETTFSTRFGKVAAYVHRSGSSDSSVVFLHGNSASKELFEGQMDVCAALGVNCLALDFPGHGRSDDATDPQAAYSMPGYAAAVSDILNELQWGDVRVVGWSLGGHVALELMASDQRVTGCMIVGTPPVQMSEESVAVAFLPTTTMSLAFKPNFDRADAVAYGQAMLGESVSVTDEFVGRVRRTDGNARLWLARNGIAGTGIDQKELVELSAVPLAVVHGTRDAFVNIDYLRSLTYRNLWRGEVQLLDAGHAPHVERPEDFNKLLTSFLADTQATSDKQIQASAAT